MTGKPGERIGVVASCTGSASLRGGVVNADGKVFSSCGAVSPELFTIGDDCVELTDPDEDFAMRA